MFAVEHWKRGAGYSVPCEGIASGCRSGRIVARGDVMDLAAGSHASTFGGNPVSCRAALATIDLLQSEYIANAAARGDQLRARSARIAQRKFPLIGDVPRPWADDGHGSRQVRERSVPRIRSWRETIVQTAFRRGLLLLGCGESAIRFCPRCASPPSGGRRHHASQTNLERPFSVTLLA